MNLYFHIPAAWDEYEEKPNLSHIAGRSLPIITLIRGTTRRGPEASEPE